MQRLLSIDIGIRNLALCVLDTSETAPPQIVRWEVLDLAPPLMCQTCGERIATLTKREVFVCRGCARSLAPGLIVITPKLRLACASPYDEPLLRKTRCIPEGTRCTQTSVRRFLRDRALVPYKPPPASSIPLPRIASALNDGLDRFIGAGVGPLSIVAIENQIGPQAIRMKAIQAMVTQHLITAGHCAPHSVIYVSATEKLRAFPEHKGLSYGQRKLLGVKACEHILTRAGEAGGDRLIEFHSNTKRDDLADAFLQGIAVAVNAGRAAPPGWGSPDVRIT